MKTSTLPQTDDHPLNEMIETWAANLALDDVTLAPFMPSRLPCAAPDSSPHVDPQTARLHQLIARAKGQHREIIC
jgi:hypothetical protein